MLLSFWPPIDFWSAPSASEIQNGPVDLVPPSSGGQAQTSVSLDRCIMLNQSRQGKLCFINPLFLQLEVSKVSICDLRGFFFFKFPFDVSPLSPSPLSSNLADKI